MLIYLNAYFVRLSQFDIYVFFFINVYIYLFLQFLFYYKNRRISVFNVYLDKF